jgi:hypothetical protein
MYTLTRMMMIGTIALAITVSSGMWGNTANAQLLITIDELDSTKMLPMNNDEIEDELYDMLGYKSEQEFTEALSNYSSLAEIAEVQQVDVQEIIALQSSQLMEQMVNRLTKGELSLHEFSSITAEVPEIIRKSVYGETS